MKKNFDTQELVLDFLELEKNYNLSC
jgi:hypothetical protein